MKKSVVISLHIGYWMVYLLLLCVLSNFLVIPHLNSKSPFPWLGNFIILLPIAIGPGFASFYIFNTVLFKKFLSRKKTGRLFLFGILVSIACGIEGLLIIYFATFQKTTAGKFNYDFETVAPIAIILFLNALINGIAGLVIKGFTTSYSDIKLKEDLGKKNYEMELALIKSQINPHFLFNTINNIDVLIEKDATKASVYLNKLSDIMRFMLYETKTEKITLEKELTYIEKYIDLQKIRTSNVNYVNYFVQGDSTNLMIAPMLFIPFIENAFKHTENKKVENAINIKVTVEKEFIIFDCENNYTSETQVKPDQGGLGNELIQKRLLLLYPDKHTLEIINKNNNYRVQLTLIQ